MSRELRQLHAYAHRYVAGDRVRLVPDELEGFAEEFGTVAGLGVDGMYVVELDPEFANGDWDDGLREVYTDQLELVKAAS